MNIGITGLTKTSDYSGVQQTFPETLGDPFYMAKDLTATGLFNDSKINCKKNYQATGKDLNTYYMGINISDFSYSDSNINASFTLIKDGSLTIKAKNITGPTFACTATNLIYNGNPQTTSVLLKDGDNTTLKYGVDYVLGGTTTATNYGTYYVSVTGIGSYTGTRYNVPWTISKANIEVAIVGSSKSTVYTGQWQDTKGFSAQVVAGASSALYDPGKVALAPGSSDLVGGTNAGSYTKSLTANDFIYKDSNVNCTFKSGATYSLQSNNLTEGETIATVELVINKKVLTVTASEAKRKDGQPVAHQLLSNEIDGAVDNQVITGTVSTTPEYDVGVYRGDQLQFKLFVNNNPLPLNSNDDEVANYSLSNNSVLVIYDPDAEGDVYIVGTSQAVDYDGNAHAITGTTYKVVTSIPNFDVSKLSITGETDITNKINAGTYNTSFTATYDGNEVPADNITQVQLTINKKSLLDPSVSASLDANTFVYDGEGHAPSSATVEDSKATISDSDYTVQIPGISTSVIPGVYNVRIVAEENGNYKDTKVLTYSISKATRIVKVSGRTETADYNGEPHTATGFTYKEYSDSTTEADALLDPAQILPASDACKVTATEIGDWSMGLDAGKFSYAGANKDYINISFEIAEDGLLKIVSPTFDSVEVDQTEFVYNGKEQGPNVTMVKDSNGKVIDPSNYVVTENRKVDANTGDDKYVLVVKGIGNYSGISKTIDWYIFKANRTVNIVGTKAKYEYTGNTESVVGYEATENVPGEESALIDKAKISPAFNECVASQKDVGMANMELKPEKFSYADSNNINVTFEVDDGSVEIIKRNLENVTINLSPEELVYNGKNQSPTIALNNGDYPLTEGWDYTLSGDVSKIDVGEYTIKIKGTGNNYEDEVEKK